MDFDHCLRLTPVERAQLINQLPMPPPPSPLPPPFVYTGYADDDDDWDNYENCPPPPSMGGPYPDPCRRNGRRFRALVDEGESEKKVAHGRQRVLSHDDDDWVPSNVDCSMWDEALYDEFGPCPG